MSSRRRFLTTIIAGALPAAALGVAVRAQERSQPRTQNPAQQKEEDPSSPLKPDNKAVLEANQKDIKKNVEKLYDLASELKNEVEKTDSVQVLSLALLKKTEEIEKLAKEIRSRAKG
jgi:uncharacterized protein HemX